MLSKLFSDKKRLISSLAILMVIVPTIVLTRYAGEPGRIIGLIVYASIAMVGLYEVFKALGMHKIITMIMPLVVLPFIFINWYPFQDFITGVRSHEQVSVMLKSSLGEWKTYLIALVVTLLPLVDDNYRRQKGLAIRQFIVIFAIFVTMIFAKAVWIVNINSLFKVMFFIGIAIIADTMAYAGGMLFGKKWFNGKKFAPVLSPKKTWAGFVVGVSCAITYSVLVGYFGNIWSDFKGNKEIIVAVLGGVGLSLVAPYGDLAFSAIKRYTKIKDFSNLIPGHGGIYDRIDALSIVFVFGSIIYLLA